MARAPTREDFLIFHHILSSHRLSNHGFYITNNLLPIEYYRFVASKSNKIQHLQRTICNSPCKRLFSLPWLSGCSLRHLQDSASPTQARAQLTNLIVCGRAAEPKFAVLLRIPKTLVKGAVHGTKYNARKQLLAQLRLRCTIYCKKNWYIVRIRYKWKWPEQVQSKRKLVWYLDPETATPFNPTPEPTTYQGNTFISVALNLEFCLFPFLSSK